MDELKPASHTDLSVAFYSNDYSKVRTLQALPAYKGITVGFVSLASRIKYLAIPAPGVSIEQAREDLLKVRNFLLSDSGKQLVSKVSITGETDNVRTLVEVMYVLKDVKEVPVETLNWYAEAIGTLFTVAELHPMPIFQSVRRLRASDSRNWFTKVLAAIDPFRNDSIHHFPELLIEFPSAGYRAWNVEELEEKSLKDLLKSNLK